MQKPNVVRLHIDERMEYRLRREMPWIFRKYVDFGKKTPENGDLVAVYGKRDTCIGIGLYDAYSPICVRMLGKSVNFSRDYFVSSLKEALLRRAEASIISHQTTGIRLLSGESEGLPGLVIDVYGSTWVLKVYSAIWLPYLKTFLEVVRSVCFEGACEIHGAWGETPSRLVLRFGREVRSLFEKAGFQEAQLLIGEDTTPYATFLEHGAVFRAQVFKGQKTGFFLDQRDNRHLVRSLASGRRVLDICCYSGGFSINAAIGGATEVWSLDGDRHALELVDQHYTLNANHAGVASSKHIPVRANMFDWIERARDKKTRFELVIADPPSFASSQAQLETAEKAYVRLFSEAASLLEPHGQILCCSCSSHVGQEKFSQIVERALKHKTLTAIDYSGLPADHVAKFAEARYLKAWLVTVK